MEIVATMQSTKDNYIFVSEEMGCGKNNTGSTSVEAYYNQKWLKNHPRKNSERLFLSQEVNYRGNCYLPFTFCRKWKAEVESQIPRCCGYSDHRYFLQLSSMREKSPQGEKWKGVFYFLKKEFAKGYTYRRPVPKQVSQKACTYANVCYDCLEASTNQTNATHQAGLQKGPWTQRSFWKFTEKADAVKENGIPTCIQLMVVIMHIFICCLIVMQRITATIIMKRMQCPSVAICLLEAAAAVYEGEVKKL